MLFRSRLADLPIVSARTCYPPKWVAVGIATAEHMKTNGPGSRIYSLFFLERPEPIVVTDFFISTPSLLPWIEENHPLRGMTAEAVYRYILRKYFRPRAAVLDAAQSFYDRHLAGAPNIAVHMRGSDKKDETKTTALLPEYFQHLDEADKNTRIFLFTDDARCIEPFRERYGARVVTADVLRTETDIGVHHTGGLDKVRLGMEAMTEVYTALLCGRFLGNGMSNMSAFVSVLKDWPEDACVLLNGSILQISLT